MNVRGLRFWPALAFTHRWLGIAGCLLFVDWFMSGIVMMYVGMPALTAHERLAHAQPLVADTLRLSPADAAALSPVPPESGVQLAMLRGRPVYRLAGAHRLIFADTGETVGPPSRDEAAKAVMSFLGVASPAPRYVTTLVRADQWTLALQDRFPLEHFALDDPDGSEFYVSQGTSAVVLDSTRRERLLAYAGPVAHWLYLPVLRRHGPLWTQVILWSSGLGCLLCVSGLVAGLMRFSWSARFRLRERTARTPYRGWLKWHHYAGLSFGAVTLTWTFSGLLSMGPFALLSNENIERPLATTLAGARMSLAGLSAGDVRTAISSFRSVIDLKEMRLIVFQGHRYWLGTAANSRSRLVDADQPAGSFEQFRHDEVETAALSARHGVTAELTWLTRYDEYYYDRSGERPLPVLRARYGDRSRTWSYVDPAQGAVVLAVGRRDRVNRWLYHGLHSLDPQWLRDRRPLWDIVVIALALGGLAGVVTSLVPGWRRLRTVGRRRER